MTHLTGQARDQTARSCGHSPDSGQAHDQGEGHWSVSRARSHPGRSAAFEPGAGGHMESSQ